MCYGHVTDSQVVKHPQSGQTAVYRVTSFQTNQAADLPIFKGVPNS